MDKRVFLAACDDYSKAQKSVERILNAFGGAKAILAGRKNVLVKPNLLMPRSPDMATTTHPSIVEAVCRCFIRAGAKVTIIDSTGGPHSVPVLKLLYTKCGMIQAAENSGAELSYNTSSCQVCFPEGKVLKKLDILEPVNSADLVISVGKIKSHALSYYTGAVKNMFGVIPGMRKPALHGKYRNRDDFLQMIVDVCECVKPGFSILDGVVGMEGEGPSGGRPKKLGVVLGGYNPHACDLAACHLISFPLVPTLEYAQSRSLIPERAALLDWMGDDPERIKTVFCPPGTDELNPFLKFFLPRKLSSMLRQRRASYPMITEKCVGCGDCVRVCPEKAIVMLGKGTIRDTNVRPVSINTDRCIKCYCCHEFCPAKAIVKTPR